MYKESRDARSAAKCAADATPNAKSVVPKIVSPDYFLNKVGKEFEKEYPAVAARLYKSGRRVRRYYSNGTAGTTPVKRGPKPTKITGTFFCVFSYLIPVHLQYIMYSQMLLWNWRRRKEPFVS